MFQFGQEASQISAPWPGIESAPHTLEEGEVLTTGRPAKPLNLFS